ncbi:hypothetical protein C4587_02990 [Candidatus Parcubacteria bacterium]|nr:MAG: hypothetical protein C4587_02990 [Candidatus Parcubacteria bacterium]
MGFAGRTLLVIALLAATRAGVSFAATSTLYAEVATSPILVGSAFEAKILLDSTEALGAYEVELLYQPQYLAVVELNTSGSIVDTWQSGPGIFAGENNVIRLRGASSNSFEGERGELLTILFLPAQEGVAELRFHSASVSLLDGSKVTPVYGPLAIAISGSGSSGGSGESSGGGASPSSERSGGSSSGSGAPLYFSTSSPPLDSESPVFTADPSDSSKKILTLPLSSAESGAENVEVRSRTILPWSDWQPVQESASIPRGAWAVEVRTIDGRGGVARKTFYDWRAFGRFPLVLFPVFAVAAGAVVAGYAYVRLRSRREI